MKNILLPAFVSLLVLARVETADAQDTIPANPAIDTIPTISAPPAEPVAAPIPPPAAPAVEPAGPYRADSVSQAAVPCVRQVRRIPPPPSPRRFRRQWPLAAVGSVVGWFVGDRIVGPKGSPLVILSGSTLGAIVGSHVQASSEGHPNLGRSVLGGVLGALPAGAVLYLNHMDTYNEREMITRGVIPVLGGSLQAAVTAGATSSSLQPTRIQIIECTGATG
ncbi:MAG TPA: hypothetical protein VF006_33325 [Longimicrobium sp.]